MGRVAQQSGDPRKPTRTDAAMLAPLADLAVRNLEEALAEDADLVWTSGFHYGSFIEEARALAPLLEDMTYRCVTARLSVAGGARVGEMQLVLPAEGRGRKPNLLARGVPASVAGPAFSAALSARVEAADCQLQAVVGRVALSLAETMQLQAGAVLPLPSASLDRVSIQGLDGREVGLGKLGQHRGMRAIRLMEAEQQGTPHTARPASHGKRQGPASDQADFVAGQGLGPSTAQDWAGRMGLGGAEIGTALNGADHVGFPAAQLASAEFPALNPVSEDVPAPLEEGDAGFPAMDFDFTPMAATGTD
jgi:flagellar motor switch protein FliM